MRFYLGHGGFWTTAFGEQQHLYSDCESAKIKRWWKLSCMLAERPMRSSSEGCRKTGPGRSTYRARATDLWLPRSRVER